MSKKGTWQWACEQLANGKRVKRPGYFPLHVEAVACELVIVGTIFVADFEATDWELVDE